MAHRARRTQSRKPIPFMAMGAACLILIAAATCAVLAQDTAQPTYTIHARVPLTIVDVVVTDSKGRPVHGLQQSDFTLLEDKEPMKLNSFEEHRSDQPDETANTLVKQELPANTFTNVAPTPTDRPINLFLIDTLNTPTWAQVHVRQQMSDYVKKMPSGTRVAVFGLGMHLFVIQGFTSDPELLQAAITGSEKLMPLYSSLEDTGQDLAQPAKPLEQQGNDMAQRALITFSAINQIALYLSGMPGRKNLIWASAAFPLQFPPEPRDPVAFPLEIPQMYDFTEDMKSMGDMLARAHIAVYPIEPRGLDSILKPGARKPLIEFGEHGSMDMVAELTGGTNYHNTNGITEALDAAVSSGSNFYTLTYAPVNQTLDTRFRAISVKVNQPGLHLVYRSGYYAINPGTSLAGKKIPRATPMQAAMMRGGLEPTQILFKVKVSQAPGTEVALPVSNQPDIKLMKPPYRHYTLSYDIDIHGIEFNPSPDGNYRGDFEYGVRVYNADGDEVMNSASKTVSPILPPAVYKSMLNGGANAHLDIDVPAAGNYFLRIAVHDLASDRVGAIEIPVSSVTPDPAPSVAAVK